MMVTRTLDGPPQAPDLDQLAMALDPRQALRAYQRVWRSSHGAPARQISIERVHFSAKRPPIIHYRVHRAGQPAPELALAELVGADALGHAENEAVRLSKSRRRQLGKGEGDRVIADIQTGLVFRPPGLDARLPGLKLLHQPELALQIAAEALGIPTGRLWAKTRLCAQRLGKRAVIRIDLSGRVERTVFARVSPVANMTGRRSYERHVAIADALAGATDIAVPAPIGFIAEIGAGLFTQLPGAPPVLSGLDGFRSVCLTLRALEALQSVAGAEQRRHEPCDELAILRDWAAWATWRHPVLGGPVGKALDRIQGELASIAGATQRLCHRDFHEGQVLLDRTRAGLMDFDTVAQSDPMLDVGNFIAHLRLAGLRRGRNVAPFESTAARGPRRGRTDGEWRRIGIWRRAALLRLGCLYSLTSEPRKTVSALIAGAAS